MHATAEANSAKQQMVRGTPNSPGQCARSVVRTFDTRGMLDMAQDLREDAAKLAAAPLWSLSDDDLIACLRATHRCEQALAVLKFRLVRQVAGRGIPARRGSRTTARWLREELLLDPVPARELDEHAVALATRPVLEEAVIDGAIDLRQATTIAAAVNAIPATAAAFTDEIADDGTDRALDPPSGVIEAPCTSQLADQAEAALIQKADQFPACQLRRLGERILAHIAPDIADRADEAALRRLEARAHRKRTLTMSQPREGMVHLFGTFSIEDAATINAALQPLCTPTADDHRSAGQRRADALIDICFLALRTGRLPEHGGEPPQVTVTVPFDPLTEALGTATTDNGERMSAATARRLACDARILPIVLGGAGQVLDAGRSRRLATGALRQALVARDRGCAFPGCDRPPRWCDAHHLRPWSEGGPTRLDNLVLLCRHHHRTLHDPTTGWSARLGRDSLPEFVPPPWTDPAQRPRRNDYHLRI